MRTWNLKSGDPLQLILAADARLGPTDYTNDQIWELELGQGEPPSLALHTTYGLRARAMRILPRFSLGEHSTTNPASFHKGVRILHFYPNYFKVSFSPFPDVDVQCEYWVPSSQIVSGRVQVSNQSQTAQPVHLDLIALLTPQEGERMAPIEIQAAPALAGKTNELTPVVFMTGGPEAVSSPYPALCMQFELSPGGAHTLTWAHAALQDVVASFNLARETVTRPWDAEIARVELLNAGQLEILTGNRDWDAAFAWSQKVANQVFVGPSENLPAPSFVIARKPDQGYSPRGDGSDYSHLWNGQTPLEANFLTGLILPGSPELIKGLLQNFVSARNEAGEIDWKPGLAGQRSRILATPILANIAWQVYQVDPDKPYLSEIFPHLVDFLHTWFDGAHDRDGDGYPEWDHPMQAGYENHPLFSYWHHWAQGVDISSAESPSLSALLLSECLGLIELGRELERTQPLPALETLADHLRTLIERAWDEQASTYRYWDRDTNYPTQSEHLGDRQGPGEIGLYKEFKHPVRLLIQLQVGEGTAPRPELFIHGLGSTGGHLVERLEADQMRWFMNQGSLTSTRVYSVLERIELKNLRPDDRVSLYSIGYDLFDQTLLLPLWAGAPDQRTASMMVKNTILPSHLFGASHGLPACPNPPIGADIKTCRQIHIPWNTLIGEGLVKYGFRDIAADLVEKLMGAVIQNLKEQRSFYHTYDADTGQGIGERNALSGLAPLGLFLETLGVKIISPRRMHLTGTNPFPWPVTVKYRGTTVLRQTDKTVITFSNGASVTVPGGERHIVNMELDQDSG